MTPQTGPLAAMGEVDDYVLKRVQETLKDGVANPAGRYPIEILVKDSQGNPNRAAEVAGELILQNNIDRMVVGATPENTNPVCDQCELNGVLCISTTAPWQPWFFGRRGDPMRHDLFLAACRTVPDNPGSLDRRQAVDAAATEPSDGRSKRDNRSKGFVLICNSQNF